MIDYAEQEGLSQEEMFRCWIEAAPGAFHINQFTKDQDVQLSLIEKCEQMVSDGLLNNYGNKRGWYTPRNFDLEEMDFMSANDTPVHIWLPFDLTDLVNIYPDNLIVIAGSNNSGKTCINLNIIKENMHRFNVHFFNSEMSPAELKMRLKRFDYIDLDQWRFSPYKRCSDFADVIVPGEGNLNIIDYLECHEDFFAMGKKLKDIHDRLDGAIAIVSIQKNPGADTGLGGYRTLEVTRLAISLDFGKCKIVKAKNKIEDDDLFGKVCNFKILHGSQIKKLGGWNRDER